MPPTDQITSRDPWFLKLWKKAGVTSKKTANLYTTIIAVVLLVVTAFMYMGMLGGGAGTDPEIEDPTLLEDLN